MMAQAAPGYKQNQKKYKYRETTNKKENEMRSCLSSSSFLIYKYSLSVVWIVVWIAPVGYVSSAAAQKESQMS